MFENNKTRCAHCKFSYYSEETMTLSVLPPVLRCGKLDSSCKSGECPHFEPKSSNGLNTFEDGHNWRITA